MAKLNYSACTCFSFNTRVLILIAYAFVFGNNYLACAMTESQYIALHQHFYGLPEIVHKVPPAAYGELDIYLGFEPFQVRCYYFVLVALNLMGSTKLLIFLFKSCLLE